jgi:arabinose-5-phosphate isomerase
MQPATAQRDDRSHEGSLPGTGSVGAGREVLRLEAEALTALAAALDARFDRAVSLMGGVTGRVVVTGIGKSGHVARKIAATLASTGTPSLFVHPSEASHGDLGMIAPGDAVLALSNSGASPEMAHIVAYSRRHAIPLIAVTARSASPLGEQADVVLELPPVEEACPMGLAPTTSTTMMLALGDALAIALLQRQGFSSDDFRLLHPGGALGRRLIKVADIMHGGVEIPLVGPSTPMAETLLVMTAKRFGCAGVADADGRLIGIITDGDLRRHMAPDLMSRQAGEVMTQGPRIIRSNALAAEALALMNRAQITSLFVLDEDDRPQGILHVHDCLRAGIA